MAHQSLSHTTRDIQTRPALDTALDVLLYSLSETSQRQYRHTFKLWADFASANGFSQRDMSAQNIIAFLNSQDIAHSTKQARLSHLRKLLGTLHAQAPGNEAIEAMYRQAQLLKVKRNGDDTPEREPHALKRQQVYQMFNMWADDTLSHTRNRALLAILFYAGLRRSEAVALQWRDIDLESGLITVRHGKGDKERTIPLVGDGMALDYVTDWHDAAGERIYVFPSIDRWDNLGPDTPMSAQAAYDMVRKTGKQIGIDSLATHDARRTLLTSLLNSGTPLNVARDIAGHARGDTTMRYAKEADAKELKQRAKIDY